MPNACTERCVVYPTDTFRKSRALPWESCHVVPLALRSTQVGRTMRQQSAEAVVGARDRRGEGLNLEVSGKSHVLSDQA